MDKKIEQALMARIKKGDAVAMNEYGANLYVEGNYQEAQQWYQRAYELGNEYAMVNLGYIYLYGRTGERDYEKEFNYFSEGALMDNAQAYYKLGDFYFYGNFVKQNYRLAFKYYEKAYQVSDFDDNDIAADINYRLALCYHCGYGVNQDELEALRFINTAESYSYYDRANNKFRWQLLAAKITKLRTTIINNLNNKYDY